MMNKLGYWLVIIGVFFLIGYGIYNLFSELLIPTPIKIGLILIIVGSIVIIGNQILQRRRERNEEYDSSKY